VKEEKQQPHVVYILTKLELGGAQKVCLELMQGLHENHVPASLITGSEGVLVEEAKKFDSVFLLPSFKREVSLSSVFSEIKTLFFISRILYSLKKKHGTIIVHTHSTKAGILGRWAAFFTRIKHRVHTIHGYGFNEHQSYAKWLCIYICELVTSLITTRFVCVSEQDYKIGRSLFPRFAKKTTLIRAAVTTQYFTAPAKDSPDKNKPFIIGTISCFKPQKNLLDLLQAFEQVHSLLLQNNYPAPQLQIIGDGIQRQEIEQWISSHRLTNDVLLLGWQKNVTPWMNNWHLFAMSSLWEGLPRAVVEARLGKLPVISYAVGGIPEVIIHGKNGFLVHPKQWTELAKYMIAIIQNKKLHNQLSTYKDNFEDFDTAAMVKKHILLYKDIAVKTKHQPSS
jgi:glycosyltransferase involved in cell wall biosynthesis